MRKTNFYLVTSILVLLIMMSLSSKVFAGNTIPLNYNILPDVANGYVIDSSEHQEINFTLFENEDMLYYNNEPLVITNNSFSISTKGLTGKQTFTITNSLGEISTYTYYFSDENGFIEEYTLDEFNRTSIKVYIKTVKGITIIYTEKERKLIDSIEEIISLLPEFMLANTKEIKLIPAKHSSNAAGITKGSKITFYNISSYSKNTIKNIVIHEIAHTWSYELMKEKIIDYSFTDYQEFVNKDKRFPSKYSKSSVKANDYSEDFAESVSFYFINEKSFTKKYPSRAAYIKNIVELVSNDENNNEEN